MNRRLRQLRRCVLACALSAALLAAGIVSADVTPAAISALARGLSRADEAERVAVQAGASLILTLPDQVAAAVVTDPDVASAAVAGSRAVSLSGLAPGSTVLIVTTEAGRKVYAVEVTRAGRRGARPASRRITHAPRAAGTYSLSLARPAGESSLAVAHAFDMRQDLGGGRAIRAGADYFNFGGGGEVGRHGFERMSLALDSGKGSLELLDSDIHSAGPLAGGFRLRGAHYSAAPGARWGGLDLFAGVSRSAAPSSSRGALFGARIPVARFDSFVARVGAVRGELREGDPRGLRAVADLQYSPDARTTFAAELGGVGGGRPTWGARLDLRRDAYGVAAEARQGGGAASRAYALSAFWTPGSGLRASARWHRAAGSQGVADTSSYAAALNYSHARHTGLSLTLGRTLAGRTSPRGAGYHDYLAASYRLEAGGWSNTFDARFGRTEAPGARQFQTYIAEQLRRKWGRFALDASYKYQSRTAPGGHRTGAQEAGARLRAAFDRYTLEGGAYYRLFEAGDSRSRGARATAAASYRVDSSNQLRFAVARDFKPGAADGSTGFSFSLTHRFGGAGGGFDIFKLIRRGSGGGRLSGRVFLDDNGNGRQDGGERGASNMTVALDGRRTVKTGEDGGFAFKADEGEHTVELLDERIGRALLASTATVRRHRVGAGDVPMIYFGITDAGSVGGRVYNDAGAGDPASWPGIAGVRLRLTSGGHVAVAVTDATGLFSFAGVRPGAFTVALAADTLPPDFRIPDVLEAGARLEPAGRARLDFGVAAERAIVGTVFSDRNGNGTYDAGVDAPLGGALVEFAGRSSLSSSAGAYMLRGLPAVAGTLTAKRGGAVFFTSPLAFGPEPMMHAIQIPAP